jgi:hypothetical protein
MDFVRCYNAENRARRKETDRFRRFKYSEIIARDKANLDIQWQHEGGAADAGDTPDVLMRQIMTDLERMSAGELPDAVDAANEGKLVHVSGTVTTDSTPSDPDYMMSLARGLQVIRAFGDGRAELSISDVARETGLSWWRVIQPNNSVAAPIAATPATNRAGPFPSPDRSQIRAARTR